jgi:hypothetical protein
MRETKLLVESWRSYINDESPGVVSDIELFNLIEEVTGLYSFDLLHEEDEDKLTSSISRFKNSLFSKIAAGALAFVVSGNIVGDSLGKGDTVNNISASVSDQIASEVESSSKEAGMSRSEYLNYLGDKHKELIDLLKPDVVKKKIVSVAPKIQHMEFPPMEVKGKKPSKSKKSFAEEVAEQSDEILQDVGFSKEEIEAARKGDSMEIRTSSKGQQTAGEERKKLIDNSVSDSYEVVRELGLQKLALELGAGKKVRELGHSSYITRAKTLSKNFNKLSKQQQKQALIIYKSIIVSSLKGKLSGVDYDSSTKIKTGVLNDKEKEVASKSSSLVPEIIEGLDGIGLMELGEDNSELAFKYIVSPMQSYNEFWRAMDSERESKREVPKERGEKRTKYLEQKAEELKERKKLVAYFGSMSVEAFKEAIQIAKEKDTSFSGDSSDRGDINRSINTKGTGEDAQR